MNTVDYSGIKKNGLIIQNFERKGKYKRLWSVQCVCGQIFICNPRSVIEGRTKSCGCLTGEFIKKNKTTHGCSSGPRNENDLRRLYSIWANMLTRCGNSNVEMYIRYGGRGIKVCKRWNRFENFLNDNKIEYQKAYKKYGNKTQIDRINNNGNYTPYNCRWVSREKNANNKSTNVIHFYKGKKYTHAEISKLHGIHPTTLASRLKKNISLEEALSRPLFSRKHLVASKHPTP